MFYAYKKKEENKDSIVDKLGKLLLGGTAKLANTAAGGASLAGDVGKVVAAKATGNKKAEKNALKDSDKNANRFLEKGGGLFGAGGFVNSAEEAGNLSAADVAKKSLGGGLEVASEVVPVARGAKIASNGGKFARALGEGAGMSTAGSVGSQLSTEGNVSVEQTIKDALIGTLMGGAGFGVAKGAGKAAEKVKPVHAHYDETVPVDAPSVGNPKPINRILSPEDQAFDNLEAAGARSDNPAITQNQPQRAQNALAGEQPKTGAQVARDALPSSIADNLDDDVIELLGKTGKDSDKAAKIPIFEGARDPASVLSRQLGSVGGDIANDSAIAFKRRSDLQDNAAGLIDAAEKALKKAAKTPVGRNDLEKRVNQALEDRANADSYFTTPKEKEVYEATKKFYDYYQGELELAGKGTLENYSPRVARKNAVDAADNLDYTVDKAFQKDPDAKFLKERTKKTDDEIENLDSPVSIMRNYSSAVSKQLGYEDMMNKLPERLKSVKALYALDPNTKANSNAYLQKYLKDQLQPDVPSKGFLGEKFQNKLISNTYSAALKFSPKYYLMNRSQGFATKTQVSPEATKLIKAMKKDPEWKEMQKGLTTGEATVSAEARANGESMGRPKSKIDKLDAKLSSEQSNVSHAFNAGVAENIVRSKQYATYRKEGMKPAEAAKATLRDETFNKELAIRQGNVVTNTTQFGGNVANKPGWLRESGTVMGFSKKWFQQYQRFPLGMMQLISSVADPKTARAIDIMRRGDPLQTKLVDYQKAVKVLQNAIPEAKKAVKAGESKVSPAQIAKSEKLLKQMTKELDRQIKANSTIRRGKTAGNLTKMWASASIIQYLFSEIGGYNEGKSAGEKAGKAAVYGAPINIPTKPEGTIGGPVTPAAPVNTQNQLSGKKLLNFVPVVGPVVNRGRDVSNFIGALTGD